MRKGNIQDTHRLATALTEYASMARNKGDTDVAEELLHRALYYESQAAKLVAGNLDDEPRRSTLHKSAASLALRCGQFEEAERLIIAGLSGMPPEDIDTELRELLKEVKKQKGGRSDALLSRTRERST
jgi:Flp pilus assembly protein TadD